MIIINIPYSISYEYDNSQELSSLWKSNAIVPSGKFRITGNLLTSLRHLVIDILEKATFSVL